MAKKLKTILQILKEEDKAKKEEKKGKEAEEIKEIYSKSKEPFHCNKKSSSSFKYVEPEYSTYSFECNKYSDSFFEPKSYLKSYAKHFKHGKETIALYKLISNYSRQFITFPKPKHFFNINLKRVQKLIDKGANVNFVNDELERDNCLVDAVISENVDLIRLLLKNGANPNIHLTKDSEYNWPIRRLFLRAALENNESLPLTQVFKEMVEKYNADIYNRDISGHYTIISYANATGDTHIDYAKSLLEPYGFTKNELKRNKISSSDTATNKKNTDIKSQEEKEINETFEKDFDIPENL